MSEPESAEACAARICTQAWWYGDDPEGALAAAIREDRARTLERVAEQLRADLEKYVKDPTPPGTRDMGPRWIMGSVETAKSIVKLLRAEAARVRAVEGA